MAGITNAELGDALDYRPQSLVGKTYLGCTQAIQDDSGLYVLYGDWVLVLDFDRTILEVVEDLQYELRENTGIEHKRLWP